MSGSFIENESYLLSQISKGHEDAFRQLFQGYAPKLLAYIQTMTKSKPVAEELLQDCFLRIWINRDSLEGIRDFDSYLFILARNKVYDHFRKMATDEKARLNAWKSIQEFQQTTLETVEANESRKLIAKAIQGLTPQKQQIFWLSRYNGLTHDEIAEQLGISKNTVKNHLVSTLQHIRDFLRHHYDPVIVFILSQYLP